MFERFAELYETSPVADGGGGDMPTAFCRSYGGGSYGDGLLTVFTPEEASYFFEDAVTAYPGYAGVVTPVCFDWLGDIFVVLKGVGDVLLLELGTGDALVVAKTFPEFVDRTLVDEADASLAAGFYETWRASGGSAPKGLSCVGYKVPLFLGGKNDVDNLESSDLDVYWTVIGQVLVRAREGR